MPKSGPKKSFKRGRQGKHDARLPGNKRVKRQARTRRVASPAIAGTTGPLVDQLTTDVGAGSTGEGLDVGQPIPDKPTGDGL